MKSVWGKVAAFLIIFLPVFLILAAFGGIKNTVLLPLLVFGLVFIAIQKVPLLSNLYLFLATVVPLLQFLYKVPKALFDLISDTSALHYFWMFILSVLLLLILGIYCIAGITLGHVRDIRSGQ